MSFSLGLFFSLAFGIISLCLVLIFAIKGDKENPFYSFVLGSGFFFALFFFLIAGFGMYNKSFDIVIRF